VSTTGFVHNRRIDGATDTFGNEGALFMNAMTWWDWEAGSIWRSRGIEQ